MLCIAVGNECLIICAVILLLIINHWLLFCLDDMLNLGKCLFCIDFGASSLYTNELHSQENRPRASPIEGERSGYVVAKRGYTQLGLVRGKQN